MYGKMKEFLAKELADIRQPDCIKMNVSLPHLSVQTSR